MIESVFVVLLAAALYLARLALFDEINPVERVVASAIGAVLWMTLAFASFRVRVRTGAEELVAVTMVPVAWLCFVAALLMIAVALPSALELLDDYRGNRNLNLP